MSGVRRSRPRCRATILVGLAFVGCHESDSGVSAATPPGQRSSAAERREAKVTLEDGGPSGQESEALPTFLDAAGAEAFPFDVCERAGDPPFDQLGVMYGIATQYEALRTSDCRTAGLTPALDDAQRDRWWGYLINYSMAMAGCPLTLGPAEGGILVFGPANTPAIGLMRPALGRDDAGLLLEKYSSAFTDALRLSVGERAAMEAHLWSTAELEIDARATAVLSTCQTDAGI